jgi:hypothetical protein
MNRPAFMRRAAVMKMGVTHGVPARQMRLAFQRGIFPRRSMRTWSYYDAAPLRALLTALGGWVVRWHEAKAALLATGFTPRQAETLRASGALRSASLYPGGKRLYPAPPPKQSSCACGPLRAASCPEKVTLCPAATSP